MYAIDTPPQEKAKAKEDTAHAIKHAKIFQTQNEENDILALMVEAKAQEKMFEYEQKRKAKME